MLIPDIISMLSEEERITYDTYQRISDRWVKKHSDQDFWLSEFIEFENLLPAGSVLDIGCGAGRDRAFFTEDRYEYTGIDIAENLLLEARKQFPQGKFMYMSMYSLDFASGTFDGFWASASLLHIPKKKVNIVLQEIKRVLKNNAIGFISIKEGDGEMIVTEIDDSKRFFAFYKRDEFNSILTSNGFEVVRTGERISIVGARETTWLTFLVRETSD